ncbi:HD domain-containing protein [Pseudomonas sp. ZM23]|uniref:HD domain-containing protein n=1 Tax=Pseudomonas triclosanedens TaxID=2961893 RepID=A0ABY6ZW63_9PSED|nr:HD domain-containing protein [Pseudomonas triclosanedens]MCP8467419.1 HD domain-containing protein [Pseudomonas triclosanedens]MCP8469881.1 HD domain-containing protein [Pseudomonas triclosanedens]MCP8478808.1 HD domain-containing protein [Pseudomonas triclosanedens]WAI49212.1 HD domain-containing protein [Pseudomonas triclosanedens]
MNLQDSYNQAWLFAASAHAGQTLTASTLPYAVHLAMVANEVMAADREASIERLAETVQIALLHDVLEDTSVSFEQLQTRFGAFVAEGAQRLSKAADGGKLSLENYLGRLASAAPQYAIVKLCDRITNLQPPPSTWARSKISEYHAESQRILAVLGHAHEPSAERLREKIDNYRRYF